MLLLATLQILALHQAPQKIITKNFCVSSLFSEPQTDCISWNRYETAGPLLDTERNVIYIGGSDSMLHIVSPATGLVQKRIDLPGKLITTPTLLRNHLLVGTNQGHLICFDTDTWTPIWEQKLDAELPNRILVEKEHAYVVTGLNTLYALDLNTGNILWEKRSPLGSALSLSKLSNPIILHHRLIFGTSAGKLEFVHPGTGDTLFNVSLGDTKKKFPDIVTDPVPIEPDLIAVASFNQGLTVLNASTGIVIWSLPNLLNITRLASDENMIITAGPKQISAIDSHTQKMLWRFSYQKGSPNQLIVKEGKIYVGSDQDALYVLDAKTGRPLQILGSGLGFASDFDFSSDNTLFALSTAGYLYSYGRKNTASCCGFN